MTGVQTYALPISAVKKQLKKEEMALSRHHEKYVSFQFKKYMGRCSVPKNERWVVKEKLLLV